MSENVYKACRRLFHRNKHILFNSYLFDWESDVFTLTGSLYSVEVEVKISRSDYLADFKKTDKHRMLSAHSQKNVLWRKSDFASFWGYSSTNGKFGKLDGQACAIEFANPQTKIPNRFYYACPAGLIKVDEVPRYAGLIWVDENGNAKEVKKAPLLHKVKNFQENDLMEKYYWRVQNAIKELIIFDYEDVTTERAKRLVKKLNQILK